MEVWIGGACRWRGNLKRRWLSKVSVDDCAKYAAKL